MAELSYLLQQKNELTRFSVSSLLLALGLIKHTEIKPYFLVNKDTYLHQLATAFAIPYIICPTGITAQLQWSKLIKQNNIALFHSFDEFSAKLAPNFSKIPHVHTLCDFATSQRFFLQKNFANISSLVLASKILQSFYVLNAQIAEIIPFGIDQEKNTPLELKEYSYNQDNTPSQKRSRFLLPGPLYTERGIREIFAALQIFKEYQGNLNAFEIHFAGQGDNEEQILAIADEFNLKNSVAIFRHLETTNFFSSGCAVIIPEDIKHPDIKTLLTAYKLKIPVVTIGSFPFHEYATSNTHILVADKDKPASLAGLLHKCAYDHEITKDITHNAYNLLTNFSGKNMALAYEKIYKNNL